MVIVRPLFSEIILSELPFRHSRFLLSQNSGLVAFGSYIQNMQEKIEIQDPISHRENGSAHSNEKSGVLHIENHDGHPRSKAEQIAAVDAAVADPTLSLESFAHLDLKKILWKIDMRLIPVLTILYLLAFLDRGNIGNGKDY
jgi:hypothetical protein